MKRKKISERKMVKKAKIKEEIMHYAHELYLTPDQNDSTRHKYSLRRITEEIKQKFSVEITNPTVLNWSRHKGWVDEWEQGQRFGLEEIQKLKKNEETFVESIQNKISEKRVDRYKTQSMLYTKGAYIANEILDKAITMLKEGQEIPSPVLTFLTANLWRWEHSIATDDKDGKNNDVETILKAVLNNKNIEDDPYLVEIINRI